MEHRYYTLYSFPSGPPLRLEPSGEKSIFQELPVLIILIMVGLYSYFSSLIRSSRTAPADTISTGDCLVPVLATGYPTCHCAGPEKPSKLHSGKILQTQLANLKNSIWIWRSNGKFRCACMDLTRNAYFAYVKCLLKIFRFLLFTWKSLLSFGNIT